jgi:hypothetical protein
MTNKLIEIVVALIIVVVVVFAFRLVLSLVGFPLEGPLMQLIYLVVVAVFVIWLLRQLKQ